MQNGYVLMTAARNEERYIGKLLMSVASQTVSPKKWVIVSDGSTDKTDEIIGEYARKFGFIELLRSAGDGNRNFGSQVRAINKGYERLKQSVDTYSFVGNLDSDVSFASDYFERLFLEFEKNPLLGLAGGFIYEEKRGKFISRRTNRKESVAHAVQMFRSECFEQIGGYLPLKYGGPDTCAEVMARMKGWEVTSFPQMEVDHHRPTTSAEGLLRGAFRSGLMDHSLGNYPLFEAIKCLLRIGCRPIVVGASIRFVGYLYGHFKKEPRIIPEDVLFYLRNEQKNRIRRLLTGAVSH